MKYNNFINLLSGFTKYFQPYENSTIKRITNNDDDLPLNEWNFNGRNLCDFVPPENEKKATEKISFEIKNQKI